MLYTLGIIKEEFKQSDSFALVTALVVHIPYLYLYLWRDSERLIYGLLTQGIIVLVPVYLYFSLDRQNADFFSILIFTSGLALPTLTLFSRQYLTTCAYVPRVFSWLICRPTEETLALIKPDGMQNRDEIIQMLEDSGFEIVDDIETTLSTQLVATWYADKLEKPYYPDLERYMTSGPVQVLRLSRRKGIKKLRELVGPTDASAKKKYKNTIRGRFGKDIQQNAIHASDSKKSAKKEIGLFWNGKVKKTGHNRSKRSDTIRQEDASVTQKKLDLIWKSIQTIQKDIKNDNIIDDDNLKMESTVFEQVECSCPVTTINEDVTSESHSANYISSSILIAVVIVLFAWNAYSERKQRRELKKALDKIQTKLDILTESRKSK
ncbi:nucleoside diphosphate kinase [Backusella circina FSU 941]|nr:nucleoside diphosphate kinase [Backusella circina FSU 941]